MSLSKTAESVGSRILGPIVIDGSQCRRFESSVEMEWLETNGLGSFASGTVSGVHTRRYHGLFCAATTPPVGRGVTLSKLEETVALAGREISLGSNIYRETTLHPEGYQSIECFELNPWPIWTFDLFGIRVHREILMLHEHQGVLLRYTPVFPPDDTQDPVLLRFRPLFAWRNYHAIDKTSPAREIRLNRQSDGSFLAHTPEGLAVDSSSVFGEHGRVPEGFRLHLGCSHPWELTDEPYWYFDFSYRIEAYRGDPTREDLFSPGELAVVVPPGETVSIWAGMEDVQSLGGFEAAVEAEKRRRASLRVPDFEGSPVACRLARAADQFIVRRGTSGLSTIIAGYPWFTDWGRDTMISLPGLTLTTCRQEEARSLLLTFARNVNRGIIPNRFPDEGETPEYNTVDATLWLFEAAARYIESTGDIGILQEELYSAFEDILEWHLKGTHYGIHVDPDDCLLRADSPEIQLTWMDAKWGDEVFTPRNGKPVEINVLWVSALRRMIEWSKEWGHAAKSSRFVELAETATLSFNRRFWNGERGCLFDVVDGSGPGSADDSIRPNQIFALSLPLSPLEPGYYEAVLGVVTDRLLTPYGLRSLAHGEPGYVPVYGGDRRTRDAAYHQGTVWSWLIGPYIEAFFRTRGVNEQTRAQARSVVRPLLAHLEEAGLGSISEIFDADAPHRPRGCPAQAWSVAELLRVVCKFELIDPQ